jgi:hypothetical protein
MLTPPSAQVSAAMRADSARLVAACDAPGMVVLHGLDAGSMTIRLACAAPWLTRQAARVNFRRHLGSGHAGAVVVVARAMASSARSITW